MTRLAPSHPDTELIDRIRGIVEALLRERRGLPAGSMELEANRLAIVYWQRELARLNAARSSIGSARNG